MSVTFHEIVDWKTGYRLDCQFDFYSYFNFDLRPRYIARPVHHSNFTRLDCTRFASRGSRALKMTSVNPPFLSPAAVEGLLAKFPTLLTEEERALPDEARLQIARQKINNMARHQAEAKTKKGGGLAAGQGQGQASTPTSGQAGPSGSKGRPPPPPPPQMQQQQQQQQQQQTPGAMQQGGMVGGPSQMQGQGMPMNMQPNQAQMAQMAQMAQAQVQAQMAQAGGQQGMQVAPNQTPKMRGSPMQMQMQGQGQPQGGMQQMGMGQQMNGQTQQVSRKLCVCECSMAASCGWILGVG